MDTQAHTAATVDYCQQLDCLSLRFTRICALRAILVEVNQDYRPMYINRALLLILGIAFTFFPAIEDWISSAGTAWYRPYQLWLIIIIAAYWNQRSGHTDEL
jgi:hypothetical protein